MLLLDTSPVTEMNPGLSSCISDVQNSDVQNSVTDEAIALYPNRLIATSRSAHKHTLTEAARLLGDRELRRVVQPRSHR